MVAEFVRLLDDGRKDRTFFYTGECFVFFVKADDLDLVELAGVLDGVEDRGAVVAPDSNEGREVRAPW